MSTDMQYDPEDDPRESTHVGSIDPPLRVQIVSAESRRWKPGQVGYARAYEMRPGGEVLYLVSKSMDRGGGWYTRFTADDLRFTTKNSKAITAGLSDEEKVAVDLLLERDRVDDKTLRDIVPSSDVGRLAWLRTVGSLLRSLRRSRGSSNLR